MNFKTSQVNQGKSDLMAVKGSKRKLIFVLMAKFTPFSTTYKKKEVPEEFIVGISTEKSKKQ